jgi:acetate kinase
MLILVSNVGSTSLKFKLYDMPGERVLCEARVERVGSRTEAAYRYVNADRNVSRRREKLCVAGYTEGIRLFLDSLMDPAEGVRPAAGSGLSGETLRPEDIAAVGFKTVLARGFYGVHILDDAVLNAMEEYRFVAPVHNGAYLEAIGRFRELLPGVKMVGVFETAFHESIPLERRLYAVPYEWYETYGLRRMGYHGASHAYVAGTMEALWGGGRVISCHLGGSCSICAILDGKSVDNSFGFSLQAGVPHGNRTGDLDPYIVPYLLHRGMPMEEILAGLEKRGGMLGLSGLSGDMRDIERAALEGNSRARLALDVFVCAVQRYIGQYYVELGGLDQLVFTGGIGEKSPLIRERVCGSVQSLGIVLDREANEMGEGDREISAPGSKAEIWVLEANEELGVARQTYGAVKA